MNPSAPVTSVAMALCLQMNYGRSQGYHQTDREPWFQWMTPGLVSHFKPFRSVRVSHLELCRSRVRRAYARPLPQFTRQVDGIGALFHPPFTFVSGVVQLTVMNEAQGDRPLVS